MPFDRATKKNKTVLVATNTLIIELGDRLYGHF